MTTAYSEKRSVISEMNEVWKPLQDMMDAAQFAWVCNICGTALYGAMLPGHVATYHWGTCAACGKTKSVTEPRDFGSKT